MHRQKDREAHRRKCHFLFPLIMTACSSISLGGWATAEQPKPTNPSDPVSTYQVFKLPLTEVTKTYGKEVAEHPMMPALRFAFERYERMQNEVIDYTARLIKRERIGEKLQPVQFMSIKVRHGADSGFVTSDSQRDPISVYIRYLGPSRIAGREVLYVDGQNDGKLIATLGGAGALNDTTMAIHPDSSRAMEDGRYPMTEIGIKNLARRLIEIGLAEIKKPGTDDCKVRFIQGATINGRTTTCVEITYPDYREGLRFHVAQIFVDDELEVPVRFASYWWPEEVGGSPRLLEEYTYTELKLNVGLTDEDFSRENASYQFRIPSEPKLVASDN